MTPIIIPINQTRTVECIVQDGVHYCEWSDMTKQEVAYMFLLIVAIMLWFVGVFTLSGWLEDRFNIDLILTLILVGFVLPLTLASIVLLII